MEKESAYSNSENNEGKILERPAYTKRWNKDEFTNAEWEQLQQAEQGGYVKSSVAGPHYAS